MADSSDKTYFIKTKDGVEMQVERRFVELCVDIQDFFEVGHPGIVPVDPTADVIKKIIEYCEHYDYKLPTDEKPVYSKPVYPRKYKKEKEEDIAEWDKEFFDKMGLKSFFDVLMAAQYLNMENTLFRTCIKYFAKTIKGMTASEFKPVVEPAMKEFGYLLNESKPAAESSPNMPDEAGPSACKSQRVNE